MATKSKTVFVCSECGYETPKWAGKCPGCGEWNTMVEDVRLPQKSVVSAAPRDPLIHSRQCRFRK